MELGPNDRAEYCGYTIQRKKDMPHWETTIGYVVTDGGIINVMPGATWFKSEDEAMRGIAALEIAKRIAPKPDGNGCDSDIFWHLMRLTAR